jgi:hypothetical protein
MKLIVTGSRDWTDVEAIREVIDALPEGSIVVHGGCRTGADQVADQLARARGLTVLAYPADRRLAGKRWPCGCRPITFQQFGPSAGPRRNKHMVEEEERDTDAAVAFLLSGLPNRGTLDCIRCLYEVGIVAREVWR